MSPAMQSPYQPLHASAGPPRNALPAGSAGSYVLPSAERDRRASMVASSFAPAATEGREWRQSVGSAAKPSHRRPPQEGFRKVRELGDLRPSLQVAQQGAGRRADPAGGHVSPLKAVTTYLHHTYHLVNPAFVYELSFNPRRVLTKPSKPMHNDGMDNEDSDYILYVNDFLGADEGNRYLILDVLGQGTFGQVVKCQNMKTHEIVAVKVIKNKPAYFNQSMMEVTILEMLNGSWDPNDEHHILRLRDTFIHAKHLCLVFELLSSNLYELIKQNGFKGLSTSLVRVFTAQLLDSLTVLNEARLIHCDLKPENILLKTLQTPSIKLVDFGSACHEKQTVYTYIQSRFYRSPEVLLGLPYSSMIDMWSLGCIAVELFLGLPLFPGTSEYNQITRIVEMLGLPPSYMLDQGKQTSEFFNIAQDEWGRKSYRLKSIDQYQKERNPNPPEQPSKRYFQATTLPDIVKTYPMARKSGKPADVQKEMANRTSFIDFVTGLLSMDPAQRWTPQQAKLHPFITGERFLKPFKPPATPLSPTSSLKSKASSPSNDSAKHPYGGLPQTTAQSSGRAYQDAAAYNQHLAQQQAYNSAHHARQTLPSASNNPYVQDATAQAQAQAQAKAAVKAQAHQQQLQASALAHAHQAASSPQGFVSPSGSGSTIQNRSRSNTMTRMDAVPPQLAKMGLEASPLSGSVALGSARQSLTPVDSRDWDRRQQPHLQQNGLVGMSPGGTGAAGGSKLRGASQYQPLDAAQQQWRGNSPLQGSAGGYLSSHQGGSGFSVVVDGQDRRLVNPHDQHGAGGSSLSALASPSGGSSLPIAQPPPAAYASPSSAHAQASRFQSSSSAHQPPGQTYGAAGMSFDPYDTGIAQLMPALKPTQYQGSGGSTASTQRHSMALLPGQGGSGGSSHSHAGGAYGSGLVPGALLPSPNMSNPDDAFGILPSFDPNSRRRYSSAQGHQNF
ncbi:kinase-like protein [Ceraceosorus guamensis]|uniref:Kinase-like protein n=1 Tax=Ceraceosorus guamensis TaxID=1522189 RepID=A0A316W2C9_9BASI|nr:kinase-like protein [Ceraceosorus guamensis]PWN41835.1 kinase-like protein [Ceraceosorus guamensis]